MAEVVPGIYNAHFNDLDKPDSIEKINQTLTRKITMVVNRYDPPLLVCTRAGIDAYSHDAHMQAHPHSYLRP